MIEAFKFWWNARSSRERVLLAVMAALVAAVVLWLGVYRPVERSLRQAALSNVEAAERYADVERKVALLRQEDGGTAKTSPLPLEQLVSQSAGEVGFTLDRIQAQGPNHIAIAIASARSTALMGWIASLEEQGVTVERAVIGPSGATGTVSAQISFKRVGR